MKASRTLTITSVLVASAFLISIQVFTAQAAATAEVNVYSARKTELIEPLLKDFTAETGIKVNLVTGKDDALIKRLQVEGKGSPADILITVDAGRLYRAKDAGLLQTISSEALSKAVPENMRDSDNQWFGISLRARPIFYVKGKVDPKELSTYEALTDEKWKGRICIRSSSNIYNQSLVGSMIEASGIEATEKWAKGLVGNFARPPVGGDTDQLKAAAAGVCDIAIANTYYYGRLIKSDKADNNAVADKLAIFWPNQGDRTLNITGRAVDIMGRGTHVNVSGIGVTKAAKNKDNAVKLMEFLVSSKAQAWYAETNNEYPIIGAVAVDPVLASWGEFEKDDVGLTKLGENNRKAVELMDRAGWR